MADQPAIRPFDKQAEETFQETYAETASEAAKAQASALGNAFATVSGQLGCIDDRLDRMEATLENLEKLVTQNGHKPSVDER